MTQWYVVHKQARAEEKAVWHFENQGFHCFIPRIRALRRHARKVTPVFSPLFRRHLFVPCELDIARWRAINGTRGIVRLLTNGKFPLPVPAGVVESLLTKCDQQCAIQAYRNERVRKGVSK
jgi:transcriptional antiterminator RfaH